MRGIPAATSGRTLLSTTQPIFSGTTRSLSTVGPIPAMNRAQYFALGASESQPHRRRRRPSGCTPPTAHSFIPRRGRSRAGIGWRSNCPNCSTVCAPPPGALVRVTSSLPIVVFGLFCDEGAWTVTPRAADRSGDLGRVRPAASGLAGLASRPTPSDAALDKRPS